MTITTNNSLCDVIKFKERLEKQLYFYKLSFLFLW